MLLGGNGVSFTLTNAFCPLKRFLLSHHRMRACPFKDRYDLAEVLHNIEFLLAVPIAEIR